MNYIYGNNRMAVMSYWHNKAVEYNIDKEMDKFKGAFVPNLFFIKDYNYAVMFTRYKYFDSRKVDMFIKKLIMACHITWRNLLNFGGYLEIKEINMHKVYEDLNTLLFKPVHELFNKSPNNILYSELNTYISIWECKFPYLYNTTVSLLNKHWDNNKHVPDDEICSWYKDLVDDNGRILIKGGYFYKHRSKRHEKAGSKRSDWSWLDNKTSEEIAEEIIRSGKTFNRNMEKAMQKRHISIKDVKKAIKDINDSKSPIEHDVDLWYSRLDDDRRVNMISYIINACNGCLSIDHLYTMLVNVYKYDPKWFVDDKPLLTIDVYNDIERRLSGSVAAGCEAKENLNVLVKVFTVDNGAPH